MKNIRFIQILSLFAVVIVMAGCSKNGKQTSEEPGEVTVSTGSVEDITYESATLKGAVFGDFSGLTEAGFTYGTADDMTQNVVASVDEDRLSAALSDLEARKTYYYRAYAVIKGKTYQGKIRTFDTAVSPDKLKGKEWLELPSYQADEKRVAKAYYATLGNAKVGRNYSILYDFDKVMSLWVAFPLNKSVHLALSGSSGTSTPWQYDGSGDIPIAAQANMKAGSYKEAAYERGHQIANADRNRCSEEARRQTYMSTNSTPQHSKLNAPMWSALEDAIRGVANQTAAAADTLYVVTGPIMTSPNPEMAHDKDGKECPVPDGYFKVVLWLKYDSEGSYRYDSIGFMFDNTAYSGNDFSTGAHSVSEVESKTGWTFFGNIKDMGDKEMSAIKNTKKWSEFSNRATNPQVAP